MYSFIINHSYNQINVSICKNDTIMAQETVHSIDICKLLIITFQNLLNKCNKKLTDINFIGVVNGPGPFTTLRSIIATVNGIHFTENIPVIPINGLECLYKEHKSNDIVTVALLQAYNFDVYFMYQKNNQTISGYKNIQLLLNELKQSHPSTINFIGNGTHVYAKEIKDTLGRNAILDFPNKEYASSNYIAKIASTKWSKKEIKGFIQPEYIKSFSSPIRTQ